MNSLHYTLAEIERDKAAYISERRRRLMFEDTFMSLPEATEIATEEWPGVLLKSAPACDGCEFRQEMIDPYGTGDSPTLLSCFATCPWGKTP